MKKYIEQEGRYISLFGSEKGTPGVSAIDCVYVCLYLYVRMLHVSFAVCMHYMHEKVEKENTFSIDQKVDVFMAHTLTIQAVMQNAIRHGQQCIHFHLNIFAYLKSTVSSSVEIANTIAVRSESTSTRQLLISLRSTIKD